MEGTVETNEIEFPGENQTYRDARNELLNAERNLRRQIETVAEMRRSLPPGGALKEDYRFLEAGTASRERPIRFSELFAPDKDTLVIYGFMFRSGANPCPMCTAFLDSFDATAPHVTRRINLAVVARAKPQELFDYAQTRGWRNLRLLSSGACDFNKDYLAEGSDGSQWPMVNVFRKVGADIHHTYATELFLHPSEPGQNPRHVDMMWPLWHLLDLTPGGRGDWYPSVSYDGGNGS